MREHLDFYTVEELAELVGRNAAKLRVEIVPKAAAEIAARSRGTPRLANNRLRWVRDYALSRADGRITLPVARAALDMQGVDALGLDPQDRKYLETIARVFSGGPARTEAIARTRNFSADSLTYGIEPYLLQRGLLEETPNGKRVTAAAMEHLGLCPLPGSEAGPKQTPFGSGEDDATGRGGQEAAATAAKREAIPEAVRHAVWRRDEGRCAICGSRERLEFDHIVPVSKGGSSTERNVQLLCEHCNRKKAASV